MKISILIPSRNNLGFLQLAYNSIRKHQGNHFVEILVLDDISDKDGTWDWCEEISSFDLNFKAFQNKRKERLGISSGYKFLSQQATQEVICHFHADMVMTEGTLDAVERELFPQSFFKHTPHGLEKRSIDLCFRHPVTDILHFPYFKKVVCLTRIEPPIYNKPGVYPEKIIWAESPPQAENWNDDYFKAFLPKLKNLWNNKTTGGHFAPFFMFREEYNRLGGNDIDNFPKQAREDSDFAFRLVLDGFKTIQIPHFVYHFASRGNRRSQHESGNFIDNPEWQEIEQKSVRNFIRKWGTMKLHDDDLTPIKPVKYNIGFRIKNCSPAFLWHLEPWCSQCFVSFALGYSDIYEICEYIKIEQSNTTVDIESKITPELSDPDKWTEPDIWVDIDIEKISEFEYNRFQTGYLQNLSEIITQSGEIGQFELGNLKITINAMNHYENDLIVCKNEPISLKNKIIEKTRSVGMTLIEPQI